MRAVRRSSSPSCGLLGLRIETLEEQSLLFLDGVLQVFVLDPRQSARLLELVQLFVSRHEPFEQGGAASAASSGAVGVQKPEPASATAS